MSIYLMVKDADAARVACEAAGAEVLGHERCSSSEAPRTRGASRQ